MDVTSLYTNNYRRRKALLPCAMHTSVSMTTNLLFQPISSEICLDFFHCPIATRFWRQQFHLRFMRHSLLRTLLQPGVNILYPCFPVGRSGNSSFGFCNMFLFPGAGYQPAAQPPTWRTRPLPNPAWLDLPGTKVPTGTAL